MLETAAEAIESPKTSNTSTVMHPDIGKDVADLDTPSAILDKYLLQQSCEKMLEAANTIGVAFRAHVKTHKVRLWSFEDVA
jgi:D-serine deaminase-like pyridoxal phosphate-dependent protein